MEQEKSQNEETAFTHPVAEALNIDKEDLSTPLVSQETIEDEEPPRINLTAVICTAIVAVCATVIICVAQPWKNSGDNEPVVVAQNEDTTEQAGTNDNNIKVAKNEKADTKPAEVKKEETKVLEEKKVVKDEKKVDDNSTLPLVKVTKTGTNNPYNDLRLVDASSRILTQSELQQMTKPEMALARNAIYARHGYRFKNAELKEYFDKQTWFKGTNIKIDSIPFTKVELDNIRNIKAMETK